LQPADATSAETQAGATGPALQIGAYKSEDEANAAWTAFEHRHAMVSAYPPQVKRVDLGGKGVWYRLRVAGFSGKSSALAFCDKLKADGGTCFLAK
jgi:cell division protein FtsN